MNRIKRAYALTKSNKKDFKYEYKYGIPWVILLLVIGFYLNSILGNILIFLGIFMSPLIIWLEKFWLFVIYLINPK